MRELKTGKAWDDLPNIGAYKERFVWVQRNTTGVFDEVLGKKALVIGGAVGGEAIALSQLGFQSILVTETNEAEISYGREQIRKFNLDSKIVFFHQEDLSGLGFFDFISSGHVIEHTDSWRNHLKQIHDHSKSGTVVFIEFPSRFQLKEPHTGLFSFGFLPRPLRMAFQFFASLSLEMVELRDKAALRRSINELQQISSFQIRELAWRFGWKFRAIDKPAPGIVRLCFVQS